jgi:hypothetical protein
MVELKQRLAEKEVELKATEVRLEVAQAIPQLLRGPAPKKTIARRLAGKKRQKGRKKKAR